MSIVQEAKSDIYLDGGTLTNTLSWRPTAVKKLIDNGLKPYKIWTNVQSVDGRPVAMVVNTEAAVTPDFQPAERVYQICRLFEIMTIALKLNTTENQALSDSLQLAMTCFNALGFNMNFRGPIFFDTIQAGVNFFEGAGIEVSFQNYNTFYRSSIIGSNRDAI